MAKIGMIFYGRKHQNQIPSNSLSPLFPSDMPSSMHRCRDKLSCNVCLHSVVDGIKDFCKGQGHAMTHKGRLLDKPTLHT